MRGKSVGILGTLIAALATATFGTPAAAQTKSATACATVLFDLEESRDTLEDLEAVVAAAKANRGTLQNAADELADQIIAAESPDLAAKLRADHFKVMDEIDSIDRLLPPIESQANALRVQLDETERSYLACVSENL